MNDVANPICKLSEKTQAPFDGVVDQWRQAFPAIVNHPDRCFFNNAATAQLPSPVLEAISNHYYDGACSPSRGGGAHPARLNKSVNRARQTVCEFIGANDTDGIVFTNGATHSAQLIAQAWGLHRLQDGDEILYSSHDHTSSVQPWLDVQRHLAERGIHITLIEYALFPHSGDPKMDDILERVTTSTRVICLTHIHHVYGLDAEVEKLAGHLPERVRVVLDIAQSVGHTPLNLKTLPVDFAFFSGHKMFALNGIGALWVHPRCWPELKPITSGSSSIEHGPSATPTAHRALEFGTPNMAGIVSLNAAIEWLNTIGIEPIEHHVCALTKTLMEGLKNVATVEFLPGPAHLSCPFAFGIVSFRMAGISSGDLAWLLDDAGFSVRAGSHCSYGSTAQLDSVRVSLHLYNTKDEVQHFIETLKDISEEIADS